MSGDQQETQSVSFLPVDYAIFICLIVLSLSIGVYHAVRGGKQRTTAEYLMANRQMKTLPVALSILVSFVSGIMFLGTPAEIYTRGTQLMMRLVGYCLACIISSLLLVPLFFSLRVTSSFEYLERRYKSKTVKLIGTVGMLIGNLFYMGLVVFTPAVALEAVTGFPLWASICATAVVATLYTTFGGLKAVIWTDVFQAGVMVGGMLAIVVRGIMCVGSPARVWELNEINGRIIFFDFDVDPTKRLSFWSTIIGGMFSTLTVFGVGQTSVQRYCALPTLTQARLSIFLNIPFLLVVNALACAVGLVMFAYYADLGCDPLRNRDIASANQLLPYFVMHALNIPGLPGALLAVLFSGALSSISSSLNSAAAVTWQDILRYFLTDMKESHKATVTKVTVFVYGTLSIAVAFGARMLGDHVLQASLSFTGATMGPTLGMFLLGAFFPFANAVGAITGCIISFTFSLWLAIGTFIIRPHSAYLPTSITNCSSSFNTSLFYSNNSSDINIFTYSDASYDNTSYSRYINSSSNENIMSTFDRLNMTVFNNTSNTSDVDWGISDLYKISFLWYSAIGCTITMVVGACVSLVFRSDESERPDPSLIISVFSGFPRCCRTGTSCVHFIRSSFFYKLYHLGSTNVAEKGENSVTPLKYDSFEENNEGCIKDKISDSDSSAAQSNIEMDPIKTSL